jgi:hypothetical protein
MLSGWTGAMNPFIKSMERSVAIAVLIVSYHLSRLLAHKDEGVWQLAMYNDFQTQANNFITMAGTKSGDLETQTVLTGVFESVFQDMAVKLGELDDLVRPVHGVHTNEYNLIWGRTLNRFYHGTYEDRIGALTTLAADMTTYTVPDGNIAVLAYIAEINAAHLAQRNRMTKEGNDAIAVNELRTTLTRKLYKNLGGLIFNFGDLADCEAKVKKYFPLNLVGDHFQKGHYQLIVPKGEFRRICIHTFKEGEMVFVSASGANVWISLADNADHAVYEGYLANDNDPQTIAPAVIGDLEKKYLIATNANLEESCDLIFNIIKS